MIKRIKFTDGQINNTLLILTLNILNSYQKNYL